LISDASFNQRAKIKESIRNCYYGRQKVNSSRKLRMVRLSLSSLLFLLRDRNWSTKIRQMEVIHLTESRSEQLKSRYNEEDYGKECEGVELCLNFYPHTNFQTDGTTPDLILPREQIEKMLNWNKRILTQTAQYDKPIETGSTTPSVGFKPLAKQLISKKEKQAQQTADPEVNVDARIKEDGATLKALS